MSRPVSFSGPPLATAPDLLIRSNTAIGGTILTVPIPPPPPERAALAHELPCWTLFAAGAADAQP
jgi:hypothetical protein